MAGQGPLRVAVIGVGHLGKEHARVYASLEGASLVGVCDIDPDRRAAVSEKHGTRAFADYRDLLHEVDAVSVAVPTTAHFEVASECLRRGAHVLVEKPIAGTAAQAEALCALARERGRVLQVGHIERFNPAMIAVAPRIADPKFIVSERVSPFTFRSADVGVVHDLMIHDLDIVLELAKDEVESVEAVGIPVLSKTVDLAHARLRFRSGCIAVLTASRLSTKRVRKIRLFQADGYLSLDYQERKAIAIAKAPGFEYGALEVSKLDLDGVGDLEKLVFSRFLKYEEIAMDTGEPLRLELASFVAAARGEAPCAVPGEHGLRALRVVEEVEARIREHSWYPRS